MPHFIWPVETLSNRQQIGHLRPRRFAQNRRAARGAERAVRLQASKQVRVGTAVVGPREAPRAATNGGRLAGRESGVTRSARRMRREGLRKSKSRQHTIVGCILSHFALLPRITGAACKARQYNLRRRCDRENPNVWSRRFCNGQNRTSRTGRIRRRRIERPLMRGRHAVVRRRAARVDAR